MVFESIIDQQLLSSVALFSYRNELCQVQVRHLDFSLVININALDDVAKEISGAWCEHGNEIENHVRVYHNADQYREESTNWSFVGVVSFERQANWMTEHILLF